MKKYLALFFCFLSLSATALPLSKEGKQEARLFHDFLQAVYAQRTGDPKAFTYLERTLQAAPDSNYLKSLLVAEALASDDPSRADPYADFIVEGESTAEDWAVYASYLWKKGNLSEAQKSFERALALDPDDKHVLHQYILLLAALDPQQAIEELLALTEEYPAFTSSIYNLVGNMYSHMHLFPQALAYYDKAIAADRGDPLPRLGKGEVYEKTSQFFLMLHEFEELEKMGYGNAGTFSRMGSVFFLAQDYAKAEEYFLKAKEKDAGDIPSNYFLALISEKKGNHSQAITYLKESVDYEENASKWLLVSFYLNRLDQRQESLKNLEKAYQKFKGNVEIGYFYALALSDAKEYKRAARVLEKVLVTNPHYEEARLQYAFALESLKKYKKMDGQLEILLEKNPNNAPALNLYAYSLAQRGVRLEEAQEFIARALAINPEDNGFIDTQAWVFYKQGNLARAEELLNTIPEEVAYHNAEIAYHKAVLAYKRGDVKTALQYAELARDELKEAQKLYKKLSN